MTSTISIRELRPKLSRVVKNFHAKFDRYIITNRGKPEVVMLSMEDYESLLETLEIESDPHLVKQLKEAQKEIKKGKGVSLEEARRRLGIV